ncbi:MAG TPA: hypothetical protein VFH95_01780 [Candidatus Kapabacteria bacterium]|nr:hypothetical protein [Candidatus Kapabacteria bacterium]
MNRYFALPFLIIALNVNNAWADAVPHFDLIRIHVRVASDISHTGPLDSIALLLRRDTTPEIFDTIRENQEIGSAGSGIGLWWDVRHKSSDHWSEDDDQWFKAHNAGQDEFSLHGRGAEYLRPFKMLLYYSNRVLASPLLKPQHMECQFSLVVHGNSVENASNFFQISWGEYFSYLFSTIFIELLVAILYFWRRRVPLWKAHSIITANLISHPILWTVCTYLIGFGWGEIGGEIGVTAFEAWWVYLFCKEFLTFKQSVKLSILMNVLSYVFGWVLVATIISILGH